MKVKYTHQSNQLSFLTLTLFRIYEVIDVSQFGNRTPEYKIKNDLGNEIWLNSCYFEDVIESRDRGINSIINSTKSHLD